MNIEDFAELLEYLRQAKRIRLSDEPKFSLLSGGVSNRAVRVDLPDRRSFVLKQALPKLRVETDWRSDPRRIEQEALGLEWLDLNLPPGTVPRLLFLDPSAHLLGMEAIPQPHENWKLMLLRRNLENRHVEQFARLLAAIHQRSFETRDRINPGFEDRTFFESLRLEPYYRFTASKHPAVAAFYACLIADTLAARLALTHGDYSPKNVLVFRDRLVLLDHEVIHLGDPAFDIGFSMTHLLSKAHHLPAGRLDLLEAAQSYWRVYQSMTGAWTRSTDFASRAARHTLACLLARVDGRSPLEYLTESERERQRQACTRLISSLPSSIPHLIDRFAGELG